MSKLKKSIFKRVYNKFYINPKFIRERNKSFLKFMNKLGFKIDEYNLIVDEIISDKDFNESVNREFTAAGLNPAFPFDKISWPYFIYFLIRKQKPEIFVETGVWYGVSSSIILNAMNKNESGKLYSIDLPALFETGGYKDENPYLDLEDRTASLPPKKNPGFIIPENLKSRWNLILGDSKIHLPKLFAELKSADIFLHDSLHSYENMMFEFNLACNHVKESGYILSDNIDWHNAFYDFCKNKNLEYKTFLAYLETPKLNHNFGAIKL
jgi:hypothetical protein